MTIDPEEVFPVTRCHYLFVGLFVGIDAYGRYNSESVSQITELLKSLKPRFVTRLTQIQLRRHGTAAYMAEMTGGTSLSKSSRPFVHTCFVLEFGQVNIILYLYSKNDTHGTRSSGNVVETTCNYCRRRYAVIELRYKPWWFSTVSRVLEKSR